MAEYGDVIPVPGTSGVSEAKPADILASYAYLRQRGCTVVKEGAGAVIAAGTVMARVTASKKYVPYDDDGTDDGRRTAVGVLRQSVDTTGGDKLGNLVTAGILKYSVLTGIDANGITDLNARYDATADELIF